jgi:hypothetical protein
MWASSHTYGGDRCQGQQASAGAPHAPRRHLSLPPIHRGAVQWPQNIPKDTQGAGWLGTRLLQGLYGMLFQAKGRLSQRCRVQCPPKAAEEVWEGDRDRLWKACKPGGSEVQMRGAQASGSEFQGSLQQVSGYKRQACSIGRGSSGPQKQEGHRGPNKWPRMSQQSQAKGQKSPMS